MGNVYMEADQVRFKDSTYRNIQEGLAAALEGGGGGGTTVVANPEGSATADLAKLQVGTTIYGIPSTAAKISYDNTSSGLTADDVQEAIDELNTGLSGVTELIPSGATSSNKLATESDIPDAVTGNPSGSATAGNLTKLQIGEDIYNVPSGGGTSYSTSETLTGDTWIDGRPIYAIVVPISAFPNNTTLDVSVPLYPQTAEVVDITAWAKNINDNAVIPIPRANFSGSDLYIISYYLGYNGYGIKTNYDASALSGYMIVKYVKSV